MQRISQFKKFFLEVRQAMITLSFLYSDRPYFQQYKYSDESIKKFPAPNSYLCLLK